MSEVIIRVEGLGKSYRLHHQRQEGYVALRDVLTEKAHAIGRRLLGRRQMVLDRDEEEFWALRDVSFEVRQGEVIGIIGRNGAGKSTLLKILSRITEPTEGRVRIRGRVASLLEVGTGFHPELTGRENIYLNGAILGMTRAEIKSKFDEIVAFAEVEKFLDTPVKRYSSGMYVRLAFAVAAHLEPEILIVDEVLAVGDAEFQKKCLGKMEQVAKYEGRTVLFVSHNIAAINALTHKALLLERGRLVQHGETTVVVRAYHEMLQATRERSVIQGAGQYTRILSVILLDHEGRKTRIYTPGNVIKLIVELETDGTPGLSVEIILIDQNEQRVGLSSLHLFYGISLPGLRGIYRYELTLSPLWLAAGRYFMDVTTSVANVSWDHYVERAIEFEVPFSNPEGLSWDFRHEFGFGALALRSEVPPEFVRLDFSSG